MKKNFMLSNGWGIVHDENGEHWVFVPIWDPIKFNEIGKALFTTLVIQQHMAAITNKEAKQLLASIVKEQAKKVAGGFESGFDDDGDGKGWCGTPYPHRFPGTGGVIPGDPDNPVYIKAFGAAGAARLDAKAAITLLGSVLKNRSISKAAEMI